MGQGLQNFQRRRADACGRSAGCAACFEEIVRRYQAPLIRFVEKRFPFAARAGGYFAGDDGQGVAVAASI